MRKLSRMAAVILVLIPLLSLIGCSSSADKKTHLTFQIWDVYQRPGMQAICDAYTAKHPAGVSIGLSLRLLVRVIPCRTFSGCTLTSCCIMLTSAC